MQAIVLVAAWTLHLRNANNPAPPLLVAQVLAPEDMVYADSDVAARRGRRLPPVDVVSAMRSTPTQVAEGRTLFEQRCVTCHGAQGKGDGPVGVTLNPRPRNLTSLAGWKRGTRASDVFTTVTLGLAGTQMSGFDYLPAGQRFALTHYVASLASGRQQDSPATLAALDRQFSLSVGAAEPNVEPLTAAIQKLVAEAPPAAPADAARLVSADNMEPAGAAVYRAVIRAGADALVARSLAVDRSWIGNADRLRTIVVPAIPANGFGPQAALLSRADWLALERYLSRRSSPGD